jgi:hypothetical protein
MREQHQRMVLSAFAKLYRWAQLAGLMPIQG